MRCLLDRPGERGALARRDPHTYVCRACHDETVAALPPDLAGVFARWPVAQREARVIARALSHSSKQKARDQVHAVLAGQAPRVRKRGTEPVELPAAPPLPAAADPGAQVPSSEDAMSPSERAYDRELFDYRSARRHW
jgi:hypothetical protein